MIMIKNEYKLTEVTLQDQASENESIDHKGIVKWIEVTLVNNLKCLLGIL